MVQRVKLSLKGLLQGIGFRPYVYRLATQHSLSGWVANDRDRVLIEVEGEESQLSNFINALQQNVPAFGHIDQLEQHVIPVIHQSDFQFKASLTADEAAVFVCPDIAVCPDCVKELFDKNNRRYHHPFISCCHCGSRYSVMLNLPYDRHTTTMRDFELCEACEAEYQNPQDRRFFAQTIACHDCGAKLSFYDAAGNCFVENALEKTVAAIKAGQIIAVKGIGGFQIILDAENTEAVARLRQLKQRASKPFALLMTMPQAEIFCDLTQTEREVLQSAVAPIVLVKAKPSTVLNNAAPNQTLLGVMLPASPIQHLLLAELNTPLIATSGNRHGEPICVDNQQAFERLNGLVDGFLVHDRKIVRPLDDSIVRVIAGVPTVLRRARGYVPTPIPLPKNIPTTLAMGGQLKNTVAIAYQQQVLLSQHLGDLHQLETIEQQRETINDLKQFYGLDPQQVITDLHSDYASSQIAHSFALPIHSVQHHYAHILSCMAEHQLKPPVLGAAWDGIGLGLNNELWGGEILLINENAWQRVAHCREFPLIGGTMAIKEPRRVALGLLYEVYGDEVFNDPELLNQFNQSELKLLRGLLTKNINCPKTSSIGRLFDGFSSLLNLCQMNEFEGQAAMALENRVTDIHFNTMKHDLIFDWQFLLNQTQSIDYCATALHYALADWLFSVAQKFDIKTLVLSGGCFQNAQLIEKILKHSNATHYQIYRHHSIPPNDGGLALGQLYAQLL